VWILLVPIGLVGCRDTGRADGTDRLETVPHPDLGAAEETVRAQLDEARQRVETTLDDPAAPATEQAEELGRLGMSYHAYRLRDAAAACYRNAERLDPADPRWPYFLAHVYHAAGEAERSIEALERSYADDPDYLPTLLYLGEFEAERGGNDAAEHWFDEALERDPDSVAALFGLGKCALARRDWATAVERLEQAKRGDPAASRVDYPLGLAYRGLGRTDRALELLERNGRVAPRIADPRMDAIAERRGGMLVHVSRGLALVSSGRADEAVEAFRRAIELAPDDVAARTNLGDALARLGRLEEAREILEEATRIDPGDAKARFNLGTVSARLGDDEAAVTHLRAAVEIDGGLVPALVNLGNALRRLGRFDDALEAYRRAIEVRPTHASARINEGLTLVRLHRYREGRDAFERSHALLPDDRDVLQCLVRVLAAAPDETVRDGPRAEELAAGLVAPDAPWDHLEAIAMVAAETGDFDAARRLQQEALARIGRGAPESLVAELRRNLERYRGGLPCRRPWPDDGPILSPGVG
jgi:tetratricopeptide (TPR) repeat protein